jgi:hypothetical protein
MFVEKLSFSCREIFADYHLVGEKFLQIDNHYHVGVEKGIMLSGIMLSN